MPSQREDCLFCRLVAEGDHVARADGFVAIRDINPSAETHLLVLPERHVDTFKEIAAFPDEEAGADASLRRRDRARTAGLNDYRVLVNVGAGARADRLPSPLARARWPGRRGAGRDGAAEVARELDRDASKTS